MVNNSTEQRIAKLEHEIMRLQAINEIQNVMGQYEAIHNSTDVHRSWELWARHTPDTWLEISNWGRFEGIENIKRLWWDNSPKGKPIPGMMFEHPIETPVIVVAKDGQTARATWMSLGHETGVAPDGKASATWCYGKYACDFVKEDGAWKLWHFKWFRMFITPYDTPWPDREIVNGSEKMQGGGGGIPDYAKPVAYHKPYTKDLVMTSIPPAPAPYETYTEKYKEWMFKPGIEQP
jgi:hypothetical protein